MPEPADIPERRVKNLWASVIAVAGLIIGVILIIRGDPAAAAPPVSHTEPLRGIVVIAVGFAVAAIFYVLNNRHHIKKKSDAQETHEFDT